MRWGGGGEWWRAQERARERRGALTKASVNLKIPLTLDMDGNSLTACRYFFFLSRDQVALRSKGCNHLLVAAARTQL